MKKIIIGSIAPFLCAAYSSGGLAQGVPDLVTDDFKAGSNLTSIRFSHANTQGGFSGVNDSAQNYSFDTESKFTELEFAYAIGISDELTLNLELPYAISGEAESNGTVGANQRSARSEQDSGLDDISLGLIYRLPKASFKQALTFDIRLDTASSSDGQAEIKQNGITFQNLEKSKPGAGYKTYSLGYNAAFQASAWTIELSPYLVHREDSDDVERGLSYGLSALGRLPLTDTVKSFFGGGISRNGSAKDDEIEYEANTGYSLLAGVGITVAKNNQLNLAYLRSGASEYKAENANQTVESTSGNSFSISWETLF